MPETVTAPETTILEAISHFVSLNGPFVIALVLGVLVLICISTFNYLIELKRRCDQAAADIDVQMKQRFDLVPNLVEAVKGYARHEQETLVGVMKARSAAQAAPSGTAREEAELVFTGALGRLMAVAEAYPQLNANRNFTDLQGELSDIENKIAAARRYFNSALQEYNAAVEQFPANIVASICRIKTREEVSLTELERSEVRAVPAIRF